MASPSAPTATCGSPSRQGAERSGRNETELRADGRSGTFVGVHHWRLWLFGLLAVAGTAGAVLYAVAVAPGAKTKLEAAILFFTAAAAVTGYLGVLVGWLSYRLEAGRVPKPDLAIVTEGQLVRRWDLEIELLEPEPDVSSEVRKERDRMKSVIAKLKRSAAQPGSPTAAALVSSWMLKQIDDDDIAGYRKAVEEYLGEYESHLKDRYLAEAFWARSRQLVFAFTNERAGVPAEGVRAVIRIPTDEDLHVLKPSDIPEIGEAPTAPQPPRPRSLLEFSPILAASLFRPPNLDESLGALRSVQPQGNVSPPTIRQGSTIVEFSVKEILHNLYEDTRDHPLVLLFNRAGTWTVSYEVHARNLPQPTIGKLILAVRVRGGEGTSTEDAAKK